MNRLLTYLRRHHLGLLALFVALGGTSYAAATLPKNSVGANQIKAGAVGSSEVRDGSLTKKDFKSGTLLRGATGATGAQGPTGETGAQGLKGDKGEPGNAESVAVRLRVASGVGQSVPNSAKATAMTPVQFASATYDTSGFFDPSRTVSPPFGGGNEVVRIPKDGLYEISAGVRWTADAMGMRSLAVNGPQPGGVRAQSTVAANPATDAATAQAVSTTDRFRAGDLVYASVGQSSGGPLTLEENQSGIHLAVTYLGP